MKRVLEMIYAFILLLFVLLTFYNKMNLLNIVVALINIIIFMFYSKKNNEQNISDFIFGLLFGFIFILGNCLSIYDSLNLSRFLIIILGSFNILYIVMTLLDFIKSMINKIYNYKFKKLDDKRFFIITFIAIFIFWFIIFLTYYPGIFSYDVFAQITQANNSQYTTHHPLIHTLILNVFYNLVPNNRSLGLSIYVIIQILFLDFALCFELLFIHKNTKSKVSILYILWISLLPVFSVLAISMTKDIIFTAFMVLLVTVVSYFEINNNNIDKKYYMFIFVISCIGVALFRNNGLYVILFGNIIYIFLKHKNKKVVLMCLLSIIFILILNKVLILSTNADRGSKNIMLSIPYQQIARTYRYEYHDLSKTEIKTINKLIPNVIYYDSSLSDPVKRDAKGFEYKREFLKIYISLGLRYPFRYIEAFTYNNMGYLFIFDKTNAEVYGSGLENRQGYLLTDTKQNLNVYHKSYIPWLEKIMEQLISANKYQKNPILFMLFSFSLYLWIVVYCIFNNLTKKNYMICIYLILYILTILLGPCSIVRYAFPYICCLPLLITNCCINKKTLKKY